MALKETVKRMHTLLEDLSKDLQKATEKGNKTASQRVRTNSIKFSKLSKQYRRESVDSECGGKKQKKSVKKKVVYKKSSIGRKKTVRSR